MAESSGSGYAWESYGPLHPGYLEPAPGPWDDSGSDAAGVSQEEAGEELAGLLIHLRLQGTLSAKQACVLAHWAQAAGAAGPVRDFACPPTLPSGHYQRKLDGYLRIGPDDPEFYLLPVPGHDKAVADRTVHRLECVPPHEALARELAQDPGLLRRIPSAPAEGEWAENYRQHPVVLAAAGQPVLPLALYVDGVPFTVHDSFLGFWIYNLITERRHLVAVLRKSQMCQCGCREWCSLFPVLCWLRWSLEILAAGRHPNARHDGSPWQPEDGSRQALAGSPLVRGALVLLKGDWAEFCLTLGFPTWGSAEHPCLFCRCSQESLYSLTNFAPGNFPHAPKTDLDCDLAAQAAEVRVILDPALHAEILAVLFWDKRKQGSHGRALRRAVPQAQLLKGDRLEPSADLPDVALFDTLSVFPTTVVFWRPQAESLVKHRNPLFDRAIGVGLATFGIDSLHTLHLGIYQKLVARVWWLLLLQDAWGVAAQAGGRANQEELVANGALRLRRALFEWYVEWDAAHPGAPANRLTDLTLKTLGERDALCVRTKAAETRPLLHFCAHLCRRHRAVVDREAPALRPAVVELTRFSEMVRSLPRVLRPLHTQLLHDCLKRYARLSLDAGVPPVPKLHLALHLVQRTRAREFFRYRGCAVNDFRCPRPRPSPPLHPDAPCRSGGPRTRARRPSPPPSWTSRPTAEPATWRRCSTGPPGPAVFSSFGVGSTRGSADWTSRPGPLAVCVETATTLPSRVQANGWRY